MSIVRTQSGVSNCYVFKSRLQEYTQKIQAPSPVYVISREGPPHDPVVKATVTVNNAIYSSLPGFSNHKAAEQSAAEVALLELAKSGQIEPPGQLGESGLCKNLLQEYAQKKGYKAPLYSSRHVAQGFICTVDVNGMQYIGAAAASKKAAEVKAARVALLAVQSGESRTVCEPVANTLTVLPSQKSQVPIQQTPKPLKVKKTRTKRGGNNKRYLEHQLGVVENNPDQFQADNIGVIQAVNIGQVPAANYIPVVVGKNENHEDPLTFNNIEKEQPSVETQSV